MFCHWWLYLCMTFYFPYIFSLTLCWTRPCPHLQCTPWLREFPFVMYLYVSNPLLHHRTSLINILENISWRNPKACVLCCGLRLEFCYCQPSTSQKIRYIDLPWCPGARYIPILIHFIAIFLSCNNKFCLMSYPQEFINRRIQMLYVRQLLIPTTSASI